MAEVREFIVPFTDRMAIEKFERIHGTSGEIIRCKDCEYYIRHDKRCGLLNHGVKTDFFCAGGERREDDG